MKPPIRVLVVDVHLLVRQGVSALLAKAEGIEVVGEADDGEQAVAEARRLKPQVVLMDLDLPGLVAAEATRRILAAQPEIGIVLFVGADEGAQVQAAVEAGAVGYLAKTAMKEEFLEAIRRVARGEVWLPPHLIQRLATHFRARPVGEVPVELTAQENEVLLLLAQGWNDQRIAQEFGATEIAVRAHVSHILVKLGVRNREAAAFRSVLSFWPCS